MKRHWRCPGFCSLRGRTTILQAFRRVLANRLHISRPRIRLTELESTIAEAFLADQIGVGHALEIAKLPQPQQLKAFDAAFRTVWNSGKESRVVLPLRDFSAWIEQNILLSLDSVPFDKNDAMLAPEAGSCTECPKRTGFNTLLFGEMSQRDQCFGCGLLQQQARKICSTADRGKTEVSADHHRLWNTRRWTCLSA